MINEICFFIYLDRIKKKMNTEDITLETITETINSIKKMCNGQIIPDEIQNVIDMLQDFHNIYTNITKDLLKIINMTEKNNWVADADIVTKTFIDYDKYDKLYKDFYVKYENTFSSRCP